MKRPIGLIGLACVLSGCQGGGSVVDPFMGRSTVPPPPTVQFPQSQGGQPYYPGTPAPNTAPPASSTAPPASSTPPPGAYQYPPQSSVNERSSPSTAEVAQRSQPRVPLTERSTPIRIIEPRRDTSVGSVAAKSLGRQRLSSGSGSKPSVVPAAYQSREAVQRDGSSEGAVELGDRPRSAASGRGGDTAARGGRSSYAHAPDYSWLRGRVEYLASKRQWKLRYIPIDGTTDDYGGSVVIRNPSVLGDVRPGDFVELRGNLHADTMETSTISPDYEVTHVGN